jgi:hypothetical protein
MYKQSWHDLRCLQPASRVFGLDRGQPIDRYYIEDFLQENTTDIRGHVLEIGDNHYTHKFGRDRVEKSEVLHAVEGNPEATLIGNLETGQGIPKKSFNCVILTQTLPFLYNVRGAIESVYDALGPGGVVLATVPGICQISRYDMERWGDFWRFTNLSVQRLFGEKFGQERTKVRSYGNVLAAVSFLEGIAAEELERDELAYNDPDYQVLIVARAVKGDG